MNIAAEKEKMLPTVAAIFNSGGGTFSVDRYKGPYGVRPRAHIQVRSTDREYLERLKQVFGGTISNRRDSFGWRWALTCAKAVRLSKAVLPLLTEEQRARIAEVVKAPELPVGRPRKVFR